MPRSEAYPGHDRNLDRVFCSMCTADPPLGPQHRLSDPVPSLETHLVRKRWDIGLYGRRREGRWTPIRAKAQDTRANPNSWETHLVRKGWEHWTPSGVERKDDGDARACVCHHVEKLSSKK